ncbi:MAG: glycosyltransferase [Acidobacteria bacterium]|nr:glycosyltransferase [Acidobacteriota bacterium]
MLRRLYSILIVTVSIALGLGAAALLYLHFYFNRLEVTNLLLDFSAFLLLIFLLILVLRYALLYWFAYLEHMEYLHTPEDSEYTPLISIIVPAFNEGPVIQSAIESVMGLDYPHYETILVDDGSTDDTLERAKSLVALYGSERLRVLTQRNSGKATALNHGIAHANGEFVLCMDADSRLEAQTLRSAIRHFRDPQVGAVAGNVKVANRLNLLTRLQALEYVEGLNLLRTAQAFFRKVMVIPGPVGMFRKRMLEVLGGYEADTYAEDCDLTLRIVLSGWKIKYESRAIAWTEAPENPQALFKQRYRWSRGILQAIIKHKRQLLRPISRPLDCAFLWIMVFESILLPGINVFSILFFAAAVMGGGLSNLIFLWWAQLTVLDMVVAQFCVALEHEDLSLVFYAVLYRLVFIPYVDVMRFFASLDEMFGVKMGWGRLQRFGRI